MQGHQGVVLGNRMSLKELGEAGFVVLKGWGAPRFQQEDMIGLFVSTW